MASSSCLLLTGVTGFVGKVVLAELLRRRAEFDFDRVFVLIREKRGKTPAERFSQDVAPAALFRDLPAGWEALVTPIEGELTAADAGLAPGDLARLRAELTHVIHCAASVEFDLPLAQAAEANITSALNVLALARSCPQLRRFVSVSTAYVTPWRPAQGPIPEQLVELPFDPAATYAAIREGRADEAALLRASGHPNTYTLTKCLAEHLIVAQRGELPLSIVRPSIVSATLADPIPAWIDSTAAFAGFIALAGAGYLRAVAADPASQVDVVPCDVVASVILEELGRGEALRLRHAVAGRGRNLPLPTCYDVPRSFFTRYPGDRPFAVTWMGRPGRRLAWEEFWGHTLPLGAAALALRLTGRSKPARQAERLASKLRYLNRAFPYFTQNAFAFETAEPAAMPGFTPEGYVERVCTGVSRHLLKRDPAAMPLAGRAHRDASRSDLAWALAQPHGSGTIRAFGWAIRQTLRRTTELVTYDHAAFERAKASLPAGTALVLVPSHRSYMDFLLCSYLFFAKPELGIRIPFIAAAEEFAAIPLLGGLFTRAQAFYLRRGLSREDTALTRRVHELVGAGEVIQFFIEGARSRSRRFLRPRTGLLRCLQGTGRPFAVLPIAIAYDRVPEEAMFERELNGEPKPRMRLRDLLRWLGRAARGEVSLGRVHLACGEPVTLAPDDDVHEVARRIVGGLQGRTAVSTHHLRCFLARTPAGGFDERALAKALARRGATVVESALGGEADVSPATEISLRQQWLPWFYADALARWGHHPLLAHELAARQGTPAAARAVAAEPGLDALLDALFAPLLQDAALVLERLGSLAWAPRIGSPGALLPEAPGVNLLHAEAVFDWLVAEGVLVREAGSRAHAWGPEAARLDELKARCRWPGAPRAVQAPALAEAP